jgi:astacin
MTPARKKAKRVPKKGGEYRTAPRPSKGIMSSRGKRNREVTYSAIGEMAIVEGDILIGRVDEVRENTKRGEVREPALRKHGGIIVGERYRWPNGEVPYMIDPDLPGPERVAEAIEHWEEYTGIRFIELTSANANLYGNFISFEDLGGCFSAVGMQGGKQEISLGPGCSVGNAIHEIGHALGLWHEQSRNDRDQYVRIVYENIRPSARHNFDQYLNEGQDVGEYDYYSIMHYSTAAFSKNEKATIELLKPGEPRKHVGQREGLSAKDIATVKAAYPNVQHPNP